MRGRERLGIKQSINLYGGRIKEAIRKQIWLELLFLVVVSLLSSGIVFLIVSHTINGTDMGTREFISYDQSRNYMQEIILQKAADLNEITIEVKEGTVEEKVKAILSDIDYSKQYARDCKTYLVDSSGNILYQDSVIESLNLIKIIQEANQNEFNGDKSKFVVIYPIIIQSEICYLYNESTLEPFYHREYTDLGNVSGFIAATGAFILTIFRLSKDKIAYIQYLSYCLRQISKGNLEYKIEVMGEDELAQVAKSITHMEEEIKYQIEAQMRAEKSKNELVTNVAHDLRTPLTSIIGYIGLVKTKCYSSQEEADKYMDIAYNKSEKLKALIEDLFELTKLHQHSIKLHRCTISIGNLLNQLIEELMPLANEKQIQIETYIDATETSAEVDIDKITRVFENLIENAIKYCPMEETIYIELKGNEDYLYAAVSNPSDEIPQEEVDKLFERFYRADKSRSSSAGGSGLGLAIAKNIIELHGGKIKATLNEDLISFKIMLPRKPINKVDN